MEREAVTLNGKSLTIPQILAVANADVPVELCPKAFARAEAARAVVLDLVGSDRPMYGLNTGVGANKDNHVSPAQYKQFNEQLLWSHTVALPPFADRAAVRATMLCRLNGLMNGCAGVQPTMIILLQAMLNCGIHPKIPRRGSVGMSDLGSLAHLGLAMLGEGEVECGDKLMPAKQALQSWGLTPLVLGVKDALPIVSSNAPSVAWASLLWQQIQDLLEMADVTYAMGFEAQGYNTMLLDPRAMESRPLKGQCESLTAVRECLRGSALWDHCNHSLAGSISYKASCAIHGSVRDALSYTKGLLLGYINATDDCPVVLVEEKELLSSSNYIVTGLAVAYEMLDIALGHLSKLICNRVMRLGDEAFSGLPRFLRNTPDAIAYATVEKTVSALDTEIRHLANPVSIDYLPTENDTEDYGCNTPLIMDKTEKIVDLLCYLLGIEAVHSAQALDLSGISRMGDGTRYAYEAIRAEIPFLERDNRDLGVEMQIAHDLIRCKKIIKD